MSQITNENGWEDDVPEFDPEEAERIRNQQDREIEADIRRREELN